LRRIVSSLVLGVSLALCPNAIASGLDKVTLAELAQLEQKYFARTYATDSDENRTQRLEKLVFGQPSTGPNKDRIEKMFAGLPPDTSSPVSVAPAAASQDDSQDQSNSDFQQFLNQPTSTAPSDSDDGRAQTYPRVTAMEQAILGKSYPADQLPARLGRMETKAFGSINSKLDLSGRTDALESYAEKTLHKPRLDQAKAAADADSESSNYSANTDNSDDTTESYPRVTSLEQIILGQTYPTEQLAARLTRMETKAFGSMDTQLDLSGRTDALETYAQKTLHKTPLGVQVNRQIAGSGVQSGKYQQSQPQSNARPKQILSMVGSSLLGIAGSAMGMPMLGMVPGLMGVGAAPSQRMPPQSGVDVPQDDPAVSEPNPPAPGARMQLQVGWCEMQVFGRTFRELHLGERLRQLSAELSFNTHKSDLALMDDVRGMIKVVQARKPAPQTAGTDAAVAR